MKWVIGITLLALCIRLYQLDTIPGEMWGDVIEHYKLVQNLREGRWFYHYAFGGDGPLFDYLAVFVSYIAGLSFYSLKLTSVLLGTLLVPSTYYLALSVWPQKKLLAVVAAALAAVSFWGISFSRQAKPYILIPVLVGFILAFLIRKRYWLAGLLIGIGMYTQAAFWGMTILLWRHWKMWPTFLLASALFFFTIVNGMTVLSGQSYVGEKFGNHPIVGRVAGMATNAAKSFRALWWQGDGSFRYTIPHQAQLDCLSGILLFVGLGLGISRLLHVSKANWEAGLLLGGGLVATQLAGWADISVPESTPNMGRTIGVLPILFVLVAYGLITVVERFIRKRKWRYLVLGIVMGVITVINLYHYFMVYPDYLPNHNLPFSNVIAQALNTNFAAYPIRMIHCCWGEGGQPEPNAILFQLKQPMDFSVVVNSEFLADPLQIMPKPKRSFVIVSQPQKSQFDQVIRETFPVIDEQVVQKNGVPVAQLYLIGYN